MAPLLGLLADGDGAVRQKGLMALSCLVRHSQPAVQRFHEVCTVPFIRMGRLASEELRNVFTPDDALQMLATPPQRVAMTVMLLLAEVQSDTNH